MLFWIWRHGIRQPLLCCLKPESLFEKKNHIKTKIHRTSVGWPCWLNYYPVFLHFVCVIGHHSIFYFRDVVSANEGNNGLASPDLKARHQHRCLAQQLSSATCQRKRSWGWPGAASRNAPSIDCWKDSYKSCGCLKTWLIHCLEHMGSYCCWWLPCSTEEVQSDQRWMYVTRKSTNSAALTLKMIETTGLEL